MLNTPESIVHVLEALVILQTMTIQFIPENVPNDHEC